MDPQALSKDLKALQKRLFLYEDRVLENVGDATYNKEQVAHYRTEVARVRAAVLACGVAIGPSHDDESEEAPN